MNHTPPNPYGSFGEPEEPEASGEETGPIWGSAAPNPPSGPSYPPYTPPSGHPPVPENHPQPPAQQYPPPYPPAPGHPSPYGVPPQGGYPYSHQQGYTPSPSYGYGAPQPGYGVGGFGGQYSDKSKTTAGLLQLLLSLIGVCGIGELYIGNTAIGVTQLVGFIVAFCASSIFIGIPFVIGIWLWSVIDGIIMLARSDFRDGQGRLLRP